jgi:hypothetical protein
MNDNVNYVTTTDVAHRKQSLLLIGGFIGSFFNPGDGGSKFLSCISEILLDYKAYVPHYSSIYKIHDLLKGPSSYIQS